MSKSTESPEKAPKRRQMEDIRICSMDAPKAKTCRGHCWLWLRRDSQLYISEWYQIKMDDPFAISPLQRWSHWSTAGHTGSGPTQEPPWSKAAVTQHHTFTKTGVFWLHKYLFLSLNQHQTLLCCKHQDINGFMLKGGVFLDSKCQMQSFRFECFYRRRALTDSSSMKLYTTKLLLKPQSLRHWTIMDTCYCINCPIN